MIYLHFFFFGLNDRIGNKRGAAVIVQHLYLVRRRAASLQGILMNREALCDQEVAV